MEEKRVLSKAKIECEEALKKGEGEEEETQAAATKKVRLSCSNKTRVLTRLLNRRHRQTLRLTPPPLSLRLHERLLFLNVPIHSDVPSSRSGGSDFPVVGCCCVLVDLTLGHGGGEEGGVDWGGLGGRGGGGVWLVRIALGHWGHGAGGLSLCGGVRWGKKGRERYEHWGQGMRGAGGGGGTGVEEHNAHDTLVPRSAVVSWSRSRNALL